MTMRLAVDLTLGEYGHCAVSIVAPDDPNSFWSIGFYGTGRIYIEDEGREGCDFEPTASYDFTLKPERFPAVVDFVRKSAMKEHYSTLGFNCSSFATGLYREATGETPPGSYANAILEKFAPKPPRRIHKSIMRRNAEKAQA
ncbi:hypothetical protein [Streptomyces kronopolitis]|uniref:hypothetical protein n=1 Tax=Streptomyces kronopolitis TaxID=1612435 RepID=UPI0036CB64B4